MEFADDIMIEAIREGVGPIALAQGIQAYLKKSKTEKTLLEVRTQYLGLSEEKAALLDTYAFPTWEERSKEVKKKALAFAARLIG